MPFIETRDGTTLYYRAWGTGKPVVFVSSWALSGAMWEYQMLPMSSQGLRCIAYDRRGHGRSDDPGTGYDFDTLADDLAALLEQLDLHDVTLVGHSMGCGEICRYLSRHGTARITRVALVSPVYLVRHGLIVTVPESDMALLNHDRPLYFQEGAIKFFGIGAKWPAAATDVSAEMVKWGVQMIMETSPKAARDLRMATWTNDFTGDMAAFTVPTLVIHGDADLQAPIEACGRGTANAIAGSQFIVYPGAPHGLFLTDRVRLTNDLLAFING